jgi:hypothetical protein
MRITNLQSAGTVASMTWWTRLVAGRRLLLVGLVVCLVGLIGSFVFDYPFWPFSVVGFVLVVVNFILFVRAGLNSSVPGRPDLDSRSADGSGTGRRS